MAARANAKFALHRNDIGETRIVDPRKGYPKGASYLAHDLRA